MKDIVGRKHHFEDGDALEVLQRKMREDGPWITYYAIRSNGIPQKLTMTEDEFMDTFGHLFE